MSDLFSRFQRMVDRLADGERLAAAELAAVAPLFVSPPAEDAAGVMAQLDDLAASTGGIPLGQVVCGAAEDPGVTWPAAEEQLAAIAAAAACAVVLVDRARELLAEGQRAELADHHGLEIEQVERVEETTLCAVCTQAASAASRSEAPWDLVVTAGIPVVEVVSPYVRDVAASIDGFATERGVRVHGDDDRYHLLPQLLAQDARLEIERARVEADHGVERIAPGVIRICPAALDLSAVDARARNAVVALRREGVQVVVAASHRAAVERALAGGAAPRRVIVVTEVDAPSAELIVPRWIRHVAGHALEVDPAQSQALCASLPRELRVLEVPQLVSFPARGRLRAEVRAALVGEVGALDAGAYSAVLASTLYAPPWAGRGADAPAPELTCLGATRQAVGALAVAVWRRCGASSWRPTRGRAPISR